VKEALKGHGGGLKDQMTIESLLQLPDKNAYDKSCDRSLNDFCQIATIDPCFTFSGNML